MKFFPIMYKFKILFLCVLITFLLYFLLDKVLLNENMFTKQNEQPVFSSLVISFNEEIEGVFFIE
ncbi:MAG: hypothetical protein HRT41_12425 [Campylobacteraceae bacterium]|nr:hypothetical protein [Campylobacteraceae bacterium]